MKARDYINDLMKIGLTESEAKVYFYLLRKKNFTATEISKLSNVSRRKVYEVLSRLVDKGLCTEIIGKVRRFSAANPKVGFDNLINEFEEKKKVGINLSQALFHLYIAEKENDGPLGYIELIRDGQQIYEQIMFNIENTNHEVLAFSKAPFSGSIDSAHDKEIKALERGVKFRSIYEYKDVVKQKLVEVIETWVSAGEDARVIKELPMKMIIFDDKITIFALDDPISLKPSITSLMINHPSFNKALRCVFESYWEKAIPFHEFIKDESLVFT